MSWLDERLLLAAINFAICTAIGFVCVCRIALMSGPTTRKLTRSAYTAMFFVAAFSAWTPILPIPLQDWPSYGQLVTNGGLLFYMLSSRRAWSAGLPDFAKSDRAPLDSAHT